MKLLTAVVPCYNSADYMERAVSGLLTGGEEMDILLVDDGSTDGTPALCDRLAAENPGVVRVIHQANAGHGSSLNHGIGTALAPYLRVVDSDDRIDPESLRELLALLREHTAPGTQADLVVTDYVYDNADQEAVFGISYHHVMPQGRLFGWDECRRFGFTKQFMIHCLIYNVNLLREKGYRLPEHTFYEDNLYIYQPLPWTRKLLYLHRPLYGYFIGRQDQSVNERNMVRRVDQLTEMITQMATTYTLAELDAQPRRLRGYMINNVAAQIWPLCALQFIADTPESDALNASLWARIRAFDPDLYRKLRTHPVSMTTHLPGRLGRRVLIGAYRLGHKIIKW